MGKILTNSQGKVITAGGNAFEVTAAVDPNIQQGNIKKDVTILGVTGTYEGGEVVPVVEKDVNFYDYEGTLLYSYTAQEFAQLSAMPANPTHQGLTAQGWNWSLADAKEYVATYKRLIIGQMYITSDGKTRLYIHIDSADRATLPLCWSQTAANGVTINWGDGSAEETFSGTGNISTTHTYSAAADYIITMAVSSGNLKLGYTSTSYSVLGATANSNNGYRIMLKRVEVGSGITTLDQYSFMNCFGLRTITLPNSITNIGGTSSSSGTFNSCSSLEYITVPSGVTSIKREVFRKCYSIRRISLPITVTSISAYAFNECVSLTSVSLPSELTSLESYLLADCRQLPIVIIPNSVTSISGKVVRYAYSIIHFVVKATTPPTLESDALDGIASDMKIIVPTSSVDTYKAETGWISYASRIIGGAENY